MTEADVAGQVHVKDSGGEQGARCEIPLHRRVQIVGANGLEIGITASARACASSSLSICIQRRDEDESADSAVCAELMVINDTPVGLTASVNQYNRLHLDFEVTAEELREDKISGILATYGISVTFID